MPTSIQEPAVQDVFNRARTPRRLQVPLGAKIQEIITPFPSPEDWRDQWIYFLMVDRFNNPLRPPKHQPFNSEFGSFQGGTFNGIRAKLDYLEKLGIGALWLSPVLKNRQSDPASYHGYGIQNFLAVEPRFASDPERAKQDPRLAENELRQLIDEAHARGIYVIFDIVLHHAGDVFEYVDSVGHDLGEPAFRDFPFLIQWRKEDGRGNPEWAQAPDNPPLDAAVWPKELRRNALFTRQGRASADGSHPSGDFASLKGMATNIQEGDVFTTRNILIRAYQYAIAKYDVDGFRIDTLKFIPPEFERIFGNAMREFALSIGKKNFFTFGEVFDNENTIARFIGRNTADSGDLIGVDAALDYPLFFQLPGMVKGLGTTPADVVRVFEIRRQVERDILTSHGEAGKFFVTFLDNHDQSQRFGFTGPQQLNDQITLGLGCLFTLQGIPCIYYGTEQGLEGVKVHDDSGVREALWGKPNAFDESNPFYQTVQRLAAVRRDQPALRYGRQYFRPLSGDGQTFGISTFPAGVLAFSRILNDQEVIAVANTSTQREFKGEVIVDLNLNPTAPPGSAYQALFSNKNTAGGRPPAFVVDKPAGRVTINEVNGAVTRGPARTIPVQLQPMEIQILGPIGA